MASLADIREGLAANLSSIKGCQVSGYQLASPTPPCIHIFPDPDEAVEYHRASANGLVNWTLNVQAIVPGSDQGAQAKLDQMLEPSGEDSVFAALEADKTLGLSDTQAVVRRAVRYSEYVRADTGQSYTACTWVVDVLTTGT